MASPVKDKDFDLISTLYHALQGAELSEQYASDAQIESDQENHEFFTKVAKDYANIAQEAKRLVKDRL
ncbi:hypothetical protein LG290_02525 [Halomonas sediminis]|uniref:Uncharacterized protein n=1 Tax=Vreelandella zhuhanensis TaxID=2684210 RepID=A0A7X3H0J2_9GAMM|nr:hypothetical protein [Halomonas zhuhanensis]MWJ27310.1 hypothetical protein [Halomonas zhuhanensis]